MTDQLRDTVISALNKATGLLNNPELARPLMAGQDLSFEVFEMDSLSLFEVIMDLEERLGLELDAEQVASSLSVDGLVAHLRTRIDATV
jgi:acyl carrier protein